MNDKKDDHSEPYDTPNDWDDVKKPSEDKISSDEMVFSDKADDELKPIQQPVYSDSADDDEPLTPEQEAKKKKRKRILIIIFAIILPVVIVVTGVGFLIWGMVVGFSVCINSCTDCFTECITCFGACESCSNCCANCNTNCTNCCSNCDDCGSSCSSCGCSIDGNYSTNCQYTEENYAMQTIQNSLNIIKWYCYRIINYFEQLLDL